MAVTAVTLQTGSGNGSGGQKQGYWRIDPLADASVENDPEALLQELGEVLRNSTDANVRRWSVGLSQNQPAKKQRSRLVNGHKKHRSFTL